MNTRAQGTIEYLVIIAIIIVIALVVVVLVLGQTSSVSETDQKAANLAWKSKEVQIMDFAVNAQGDGVIVLSSTNCGSITIDNIIVESTSNSVPSTQIFLGSTRAITLENLASCDVQNKKYFITINYTTSEGLPKSVSGEFYANCLSGTIAGFEENSAISFSINSPVNGSYSLNSFSSVDVDVTNTTLADVNFFLYGSNSSSNLSGYLLYRGTISGGTGGIDYNWRSPIVTPDANTLLLFHFDNRLDFDENSSRVHDFSGRNFDASCVVGVSCPSVEDSNGYFGGTFDYDYGATGVCTDDCYFTIPDTDDLTIDPQSTFSAWVYMDSGAFIDDYKIMSYGGLGDAIFFNWGFTEDTIDSNFHMRVRYSTGTAQSLFSNSILPFDSWHHVAIVRNGTALTFYLDGVADGTQTMNTALAINPTRGMWIGDESGTATSEGWNGKIDEFAYWDRALSAQEIADYYSLSYGTYYFSIDANDSNNTATTGTKMFYLGEAPSLTAPDINVVYPVSGTFDKASLSTIDINISAKDLDTLATAMTVDLNYSTSQTQGSGVSIILSGNLGEDLVCDSNDLSTTRTCKYSWDIGSIPNGTYYILANVNDGAESHFASGETSFTITNTASQSIAFVQDANKSDTYQSIGLKASRSIFASLPVHATMGNLLITAVMIDKNSAVTVPTGFTLISSSFPNNDANGVSHGFAYKVADGSEQTITWDYDHNNVASMWVGEYSGLATVGVLDVSTSNPSGAILAPLTWSTGTTSTTTQADELSIVIYGGDSGNKVLAPSSWNNSYNLRHEVIGTAMSGAPALSVGEKVLTSIGAQDANYSWSAGGVEESTAAIATFRTTNFTSQSNDNLQQVILFGVDGMQYAHYREMVATNSLPNLVRLIGSNGFDGNATITGHSNTATHPGNAELNTGLGSAITGVADNTPATLASGISTYERLNAFRDDIVIGAIYGKNASYLPIPLLNNAADDMDWWKPMSGYSYTQYISSTYANSIDVATEATNFIESNYDKNFYLHVYFGVPDGAGHAYGENSTQYADSLINVDDGVGIVLDSLEENEILSNVKIIFSGDHGWNEGTTGHSTNDINTATILLLSNDYNLVGQIYDGGKRRQCDIAPTTLAYFGMTPSDYSDINSFGCGSLIYTGEEEEPEVLETPSIALVQNGSAYDTYAAVGAKATNSISVTLPGSATAGNLLVTAISVDKNALTIVPTGFTLISATVSGTTSALSGVGCGLAYKIATGGETTITWTTDQKNVASMWVGEYSGLASSNVLDKNTSINTGSANASLTMSTGLSGTTSQDSELAIVMVGLDSGNSITGGTGWSANYTQRNLISGAISGTPALTVADRVLTSIGDYNASYSWTPTADQACAAIATFKTS